MNRADSILPDSISIYANIAALDIAAKDYMATVPYERLLVYAVDSVPAAALPVLAQQFDVLGNKGWRMAQTDADRRRLIKRAIELHRFKGTPWAIKQALRSIGFANVVIEENTGHWARFRVILDNNQVILTTDVFADVIAMINEYKPCRSVLDGVFITVATDDDLIFDEDVAAVYDQLRADDTETLNSANFYDGLNQYDGSIDHSGEADVAFIS